MYKKIVAKEFIDLMESVCPYHYSRYGLTEIWYELEKLEKENNIKMVINPEEIIMDYTEVIPGEDLNISEFEIVTHFQDEFGIEKIIVKGL